MTLQRKLLRLTKPTGFSRLCGSYTTQQTKRMAGPQGHITIHFNSQSSNAIAQNSSAQHIFLLGGLVAIIFLTPRIIQTLKFQVLVCVATIQTLTHSASARIHYQTAVISAHVMDDDKAAVKHTGLRGLWILPVQTLNVH